MGTDGDGSVDFEEFKVWFLKQDADAREHLIVVHYKDESGEAAQTTMKKLQGLLASRVIVYDTLVRIEGMGKWKEICEAL
eukprot:SAG11_NODE_862_length_6840_cov_35.328586_6_plen_80_part_00